MRRWECCLLARDTRSARSPICAEFAVETVRTDDIEMVCSIQRAD